jgi:hypothetical protein
MSENTETATTKISEAGRFWAAHLSGRLAASRLHRLPAPLVPVASSVTGPATARAGSR